MAIRMSPQSGLAHRIGAPPSNRLQALGAVSSTARAQVDRLALLAQQGLPQMHNECAFFHTMRGDDSGGSVRPEGDSLRYAANVASGLACIEEGLQRRILGGASAADLALLCAKRAETSTDPGAVALSAWAAAEVADTYAEPLLRQLRTLLDSRAPMATVSCAWTLIAALAAQHLGDTRELSIIAASRLIAGQGASGLFPHMLPANSNGWLRAHVGSFADQVYSTQGLARLFVAQKNSAALAAAEACAERICALQGPAGQWWWHYDVRDGSVVEKYPVYSVHQHAMGPMALLDLREAGGTDHMISVVKGLGWLEQHPEVAAPLVCEPLGVIWRKAARREPRKAVRAIAAITTGLKPGLHLPGLDRIFPPKKVDYECRPYELGWLLYAWLSGGAVQKLAQTCANDLA